MERSRAQLTVMIFRWNYRKLKLPYKVPVPLDYFIIPRCNRIIRRSLSVILFQKEMKKNGCPLFPFWSWPIFAINQAALQPRKNGSNRHRLTSIVDISPRRT